MHDERRRCQRSRDTRGKQFANGSHGVSRTAAALGQARTSLKKKRDRDVTGAAVLLTVSDVRYEHRQSTHTISSDGRHTAWSSLKNYLRNENRAMKILARFPPSHPPPRPGYASANADISTMEEDAVCFAHTAKMTRDATGGRNSGDAAWRVIACRVSHARDHRFPFLPPCTFRYRRIRAVRSGISAGALARLCDRGSERVADN